MATVAPRQTGVGSVASAIGEGFRIGQGFQRLELARRKQAVNESFQGIQLARSRGDASMETAELNKLAGLGIGQEVDKTTITDTNAPEGNTQQQRTLLGQEATQGAVTFAAFKDDLIKPGRLKFDQTRNIIQKTSGVQIGNSPEELSQFLSNPQGNQQEQRAVLDAIDKEAKRQWKAGSGPAKRFMRDSGLNIRDTQRAVGKAQAREQLEKEYGPDIGTLDKGPAMSRILKSTNDRAEAIIQNRTMRLSEKRKLLNETINNANSNLEQVDKEFPGRGSVNKLKAKDFFAQLGGRGVAPKKTERQEFRIGDETFGNLVVGKNEDLLDTEVQKRIWDKGGKSNPLRKKYNSFGDFQKAIADRQVTLSSDARRDPGKEDLVKAQRTAIANNQIDTFNAAINNAVATFEGTKPETIVLMQRTFPGVKTEDQAEEAARNFQTLPPSVQDKIAKGQTNMTDQELAALSKSQVDLLRRYASGKNTGRR